MFGKNVVLKHRQTIKLLKFFLENEFIQEDQFNIILQLTVQEFLGKTILCDSSYTHFCIPNNYKTFINLINNPFTCYYTLTGLYGPIYRLPTIMKSCDHNCCIKKPCKYSKFVYSLRELCHNYK